MHFNGWEFCCKYLAVRRNCNVCALIQMLPDTFNFVCVCISIENREWKPLTLTSSDYNIRKYLKKGKKYPWCDRPPLNNRISCGLTSACLNSQSELCVFFLLCTWMFSLWWWRCWKIVCLASSSTIVFQCVFGAFFSACAWRRVSRPYYFL